MNKQLSFQVLTAAALAATVPAQVIAEDHPKKFDSPTVFQAAGPSIASIQSAVDQYRAALGGINNGNNPGPLVTGRREINWDGGGSTATSPGPTPFTVFLNSRGGQMTTPGTGFVQAPLDGLVTTFANATHANIFQPFSPVRFFSPVGSNETEVQFFLPGSNGGTPATTRGFGVVFSDVDQPEGSLGLFGSTFIAYYDSPLATSSTGARSPPRRGRAACRSSASCSRTRGSRR